MNMQKLVGFILVVLFSAISLPGCRHGGSPNGPLPAPPTVRIQNGVARIEYIEPFSSALPEDVRQARIGANEYTYIRLSDGLRIGDQVTTTTATVSSSCDGTTVIRWAIPLR
jgi:hypothetical protein